MDKSNLNKDRAILKRAQTIAEGLYPHQVEGIAFLMGRRRSILADDMGLGKTRQSVIAMEQMEPGGPYLVICPATVKRNWVREIVIVLPEAETWIIGPDNPPEVGFKGWAIINYDILGKHLEVLCAHEWKGMVFDEAHYLLHEASEAFRKVHAEAFGSGEQAERKLPSKEAVETLARVLSGPTIAQYRVESSSKPGSFYELELDGNDVSCSCRGFQFRGICQHSRALKAALVAGGDLPKGFRKVESQLRNEV